MDTLKAHVCAPPPGRLCEGPVWDPRTLELLWVDIRAGHIQRAELARTSDLARRAEPAGGTSESVHRAERADSAPDLISRAAMRLAPPLSAVLPCASGGLLATVGDTVFRLGGASDGIVGGAFGLGAAPVVTLPLPEDGVRRRTNDAKVDPRGRLLVGTMSEDGVTGSAALYRLDPDSTLTTLRTGVTISNGLGWSPDGRTLYYADSPTHRVDAFDYDLETGTLGAGRPFAHFDDGEPDGLTVDADGNVWVAVWGAGQVRAFDPAGTPRATVEVGPSQVSSCTFAGPDLDVLVITTAAEGEAARESHAGSLFTCVPGVTGLPMTPFDDDKLVATHDR